MARSRSLLAALADVGGTQGLPAAEALASLDDVYPPPPPVEPLPPGVRATTDDAVQGLRSAAAASTDPAEAARVAVATQALLTPLPG